MWLQAGEWGAGVNYIPLFDLSWMAVDVAHSKDMSFFFFFLPVWQHSSRDGSVGWSD